MSGGKGGGHPQFFSLLLPAIKSPYWKTRFCVFSDINHSCHGRPVSSMLVKGQVTHKALHCLFLFLMTFKMSIRMLQLPPSPTPLMALHKTTGKWQHGTKGVWPIRPKVSNSLTYQIVFWTACQLQTTKAHSLHLWLMQGAASYDKKCCEDSERSLSAENRLAWKKAYGTWKGHTFCLRIWRMGHRNRGSKGKSSRRFTMRGKATAVNTFKETSFR